MDILINLISIRFYIIISDIWVHTIDYSIVAKQTKIKPT